MVYKIALDAQSILDAASVAGCQKSKPQYSRARQS